MKFVKLLKYIEKSLNDKPAFLILMSDMSDMSNIVNAYCMFHNTQYYNKK